jgi:hypothetical protein
MARADKDQESPQSATVAAAASLKGTWFATVIPVVDPPFKGLLTFDQGGAIVETSTMLPPHQQYPGHGAWQHGLGGPNVYNFTFAKSVTDDVGLPPPATMIRFTGEAQLEPGGQHLNAIYRVDLLDEDGVKVFHGFDTGIIEADRFITLACSCPDNLCRGLGCPTGAGLCETTKDCLNAPDS